MEHSIGEFSIIARISVKTLRFYHEEGLLLPSRIDQSTGYRYYDETSLGRAQALTQLRALGFSLAAIKEIFAQCAEDEEVVPFLERRGLEIARSIEELQATEGMIREFLERQKEIADMSVEKDIVIKELPDMRVASIRFKGKYEDMGKRIGEIMRRAARFSSGGPFVLYHDSEYRDQDADMEVCVPLSREPHEDGLTCRILAGGRAVTLVHQGPYSTLSRSYERIMSYLGDCGLKALVPSRELYLKGPGFIFAGSPKKYLTEIQMLTQKAP
jgi:DNA-binding transcriptional MerR regulator/DNA gyrase inhibitor GyrI